MSFLWPAMLIFLLLIPLLVGIYTRLQRQRRRFAALSSNFGLNRAAHQDPGLRRHIPPGLFLAGLTLLLISTARPQATVSLPKIRGTVILAFDVSGSMAADDLKPTRMEAAKTAAQDFVQRMPSTVKIGIVTFSDNGFGVQAPTNDQDTILAAIRRLGPERGTSLGNGILSALQSIDASNNPTAPRLYSNLTPTPADTPTPVPSGTHTSSVIVLLTDGENNESPNPLAAAQTAAERGVRIYTVGIGSPSGTILHVNGFTVRTRLDEQMLQQISQLTGGAYFNAENEQDLRKIYDNLNPELVIEPEKMEVTAILAGTSLLIMLVGGVFSLVWFSRLP